MKKIFKSRIFTFILGALIFGGISAVSAYALLSNDVSYTPKDELWEVDNVKDAIDYLRDKVTNVDFVDLTRETTASNSCYDLKRVTAIIDRNNLEMFLRIYATKIIEDCNTIYTTDISKLRFKTITYNRNVDLGDNVRYYFSSNSVSTSSISYYVDTNRGYGTKQNYDYVIHYKYTK